MPKDDPTTKAAYDAAYREKNREALRAKARARRTANPELTREKDRAYRAANAEKMREQSRASKAKRIEKIRHQYRVFYAANRDRLRELARVYQRKAKYGISDQEFIALKLSQRNRCGACKVPFNENIVELRACVDHDHETGYIRGVLCRSCNLTLGHAFDSPKILRGLLAYLKGTTCRAGGITARSSKEESPER